MKFGEVSVADAEGSILAHSVRQGKAAFKKGRVLSREDVAALAEAGVTQVFAARLEPGDVPEDEAASRIAKAIAGSHCLAQAPFTGRANVHAGAAGVAVVDADRVRTLNRLHESLTLATVPPFDIVEERQMLATVKVIPFAAPQRVVKEALALIDDRPLVTLAPFGDRLAGLVISRLPQTKAALIEKTESAVRGRLTVLGSRLGEVIVTGHRTEEIGRAVAALDRSGHDPILVFGASAIVDRGDVVPQGVVAAGGEIVHLGMPVDPGNLLMLGRLGKTPVIGVPSCARSPKLNGFDWVLARVLAGLDVAPQDIMDMGAGGLLKEIPTRPSPRERNATQALFAPRIAAVVLAAGLSSRMRGRNKLTQPFSGVPMVRRAVEAALASQARPVIVVTGNQPEAIRESLAGLDVRFVHNPDFSDGLASSLKAGIGAVPSEADGAIVCLGDMPLVTAGDIDRLIAAFNPDESRLICVPVHKGRRGNPVLWARRYFPAMLALTGDMGAKPLLEASAEAITEVPAGAGVLNDFDTPEALEQLVSAPA